MKLPGRWSHRDMDPNHCLKIRTYTVKKSQSFLSCQQCKDVYIKPTNKKQNSILSLWKNLFYIVIQLLDIKRLGHWAVLKVQFCPAATVPGYDGPPVIIKDRGFWWGRKKFFTCSRVNRSSQTHLPRTVRWNNLWYTLDKRPKVTTPKIPCGLNKRKRRRMKKKNPLFPCLAEWILQLTCQTKRWAVLLCVFLLWDRRPDRTYTDFEMEKPGFKLLV